MLFSDDYAEVAQCCRDEVIPGRCALEIVPTVQALRTQHALFGERPVHVDHSRSSEAREARQCFTRGAVDPNTSPVGQDLAAVAF